MYEELLGGRARPPSRHMERFVKMQRCHLFLVAFLQTLCRILLELDIVFTAGVCDVTASAQLEQEAPSWDVEEKMLKRCATGETNSQKESKQKIKR